jgi:hypothetical protein
LPKRQKQEGEKLVSREDFVKETGSKLILNIPDPILNTSFTFAKTRGLESIYQTKGGLITDY